MEKLTPMMQQYMAIKKEYPYCLLFYRLGDFYELFFDDALLASKELDITLTGRDCGLEERAPMCGVPYHAAEGYIAKLIEKGYKVAVCEQMEDPRSVKGIVKREVVRVVSPGTVIESSILDEKKNNYILAIYENKNGYAIAIADVSTGELKTTEIISSDAGMKLLDEVNAYHPAEIICNAIFMEGSLSKTIQQRIGNKMEVYDALHFEYWNAEKTIREHFANPLYEGFFDHKLSVCACGGLLHYLKQMQKNELSHIHTIEYYQADAYMFLDISSRRNLELTETLREKKKKGTLLWVLDETHTAMGARLLRKWVEQPLVKQAEIQRRLDSVEELKDDLILRDDLSAILNAMYDFERIMGRIVFGSANGRDLVALKTSIEQLPLFRHLIRNCQSAYLKDIFTEMDVLDDLCVLLDEGIENEPPFSVREGGIIKTGYHEEVDKLRKIKAEGSQWLLDMEGKEKENTGIKSLKIRFNKVFGYYIEITKSYLDQVPDSYIRKQTLANCERFVTPELKELEETILNADEKLADLEYALFCEIRNKISENVVRIKQTAHWVAVVDTLVSLGTVAEKQNYIKPVVTEEDVLLIEEGRHPVVEKMLPPNSFVSNDTHLNLEDKRLYVITGPNMSGKSTYMRQVALIVLMAQIGSFVPAEKAEIGLVDRIFTRVGASDDLAMGQSTFMVEMTEVANILQNATPKSLLILDEIGRGTSTFDGLAIAWAVIEYVADKKSIGARTLFATHYHELTELEGKLPGVVNYCIQVEERGEEVIFLRKIIPGGADNSYGIQVARLAGLPVGVIKRSKEILKDLTRSDIHKKSKKIADDSSNRLVKISGQLDLFNAKDSYIIEEINQLELMSLSPMEAWQKLFELQKKTKEM